MVFLAKDEEARIRMGRQSARNAAQYDTRECVRQYEALYMKYKGLKKLPD